MERTCSCGDVVHRPCENADLHAIERVRTASSDCNGFHEATQVGIAVSASDYKDQSNYSPAGLQA
ncbi:hypothetical protein GCM10007304_48160 [Rhodococcoides trifolii]|jgi:hypothetical protein|uniref:Uncharacterized protein n=1 Tax=Rhodococcoides trifolii TaxID=908250 RepID=A0A917G8K9_9NOCA|nr:hypothetical protein GCM10007304_48160 [Rhodococcus trifolii]